MNSVLDIIYKQVKVHSDRSALHYLNQQEYIPITFHQMALSAERFAAYLSSVTSESSNIVIWANNCWQWAVSDLGIQLNGAVSVPIYPTAGKDQLEFILNDAKPSIVIVDHLTSDRLDLLSSFNFIQKIIVFGFWAVRILLGLFFPKHA